MIKNIFTTTTLKVAPDKIRYDEIGKQGYFVEYEIPYSEKRRWDYLHNWYLSTSKYPYFLNPSARRLYVKYPSQANAVNLKYNSQVWTPSPMDIKDPELFHALIKLLVSNFFHQRDIFVSNNDFYLLVYVTLKGNAKVLRINLKQQWKENEHFEFSLQAGATTLPRSKDIKTEDIKKKQINMHGANYLIDSKDGLPVLRRLTPYKVTHKLAQNGIYYKPKNRTINGKLLRTHIRYLDINSDYQIKDEDKKRKPLQRCKIYHMYQFATDLVAYFNQIGIPFYLKPLEYERVVSKKPKKKQGPQIDMSQKTVVLLDDRIRPTIRPDLEPDDFSAETTQRVAEIINSEDWAPQVIVKTKTDLKSDDFVLRLQDNNDPLDFERKFELDDEGNPRLDGDDNQIISYQGPLYGHDDPYKLYQKKYNRSVAQSLSVVLDKDDDDNEEDRPDGDESQSMSYKLPNAGKLKHKVLNSLYQLHLKDIVRNPRNVISRLGAIERMRDNIFLHAEGMVYLDGDDLVFTATTNEDCRTMIQEKTGWDLIDDIIEPALDRESFNRKKNVLKDCRFIVNRDYVWQIDDSPERVLVDIPEIEQRHKARSNQYPKDVFRPTFSETELKIFKTEKDTNHQKAIEHLQAFDRFLDGITENHLSYNDFSRRGKEVRKLLGIGNLSKFEKYLELRDINVPSVRKDGMITGYTGISYVRNTRQYYVGSKDGFPQNLRQEKAFIFRKIIVHRPISPPVTDNELFEQLKVNLFPLLDVFFIRYKQYTVYPFPFKLIEMRKDI
ncbi:hypothetical protein QUF64_08205 [Anaerolineales bacterium HSG6]|nr:hypothetical protein [Anaerolineales bacterium HSG6]MDM8531871.1 hypothetical protein [Anaerolineales bacterium HSG25]